MRKIIVLFACVMYSCKTTNDDFYKSSKADFDLWRLPLIKPYEINSTTGKTNWCIMMNAELKLDDRPLGIHVDSVGIFEGLILLYSTDVDMEKGWFVFDTSTKKSIQFGNKQEFDLYMDKTYFCNKVKFYSPQKVFNVYEKTISLPPEWKQHVEKEELNHY